jgi:hypothetical protein
MNLIYLETLLNDMLAKHAEYSACENDQLHTYLPPYRTARAEYMAACTDYVTGLIVDANHTNLLSRADSSDDGA